MKTVTLILDKHETTARQRWSHYLGKDIPLIVYAVEYIDNNLQAGKTEIIMDTISKLEIGYKFV